VMMMRLTSLAGSREVTSQGTDMVIQGRESHENQAEVGGKHRCVGGVLFASAGVGHAWGAGWVRRSRVPHGFGGPRIAIGIGPSGGHTGDLWLSYAYSYATASRRRAIYPSLVQPPTGHCQLSIGLLYYCDIPTGVLSYVQQCPGGWRAVSPSRHKPHVSRKREMTRHIVGLCLLVTGRLSLGPRRAASKWVKGCWRTLLIVGQPGGCGGGCRGWGDAGPTSGRWLNLRVDSSTIA